MGVILYAFYRRNEENCQLTAIQFAKRVQNHVQDDVMRDTKRSLKFHSNLSDIHVTGPQCTSIPGRVS